MKRVKKYEDQDKEKVRWEKNRREEAWGREEIILKKVIISARGFAVAQTTNKVEPVGRCAQQKGLTREVKRLRRVREQELRITVLISKITSVNLFHFVGERQ